MEFLQPGWLWGIAGGALPVLIHFWHQKKAQPLPWAASRWLDEKATLQHRGFRLHDLLLLLIRCLIIILLSAILAQPVFQLSAKQTTKQVIHLVEPDAELVSNFRFELESALKKGERLFWITPESENIDNLLDLPKTENSIWYLQNALNVNVTSRDSVHIYATNNQKFLSIPKVKTEAPFRLFVFDKNEKPNMPDLAALFKSQQIKPKVLLQYKNWEERKTVEAALGAFGEVYNVSLNIDTVAANAKQYDLIFSDLYPATVNTTTDYIISGQNAKANLDENVHIVTDSLRFETSDLVKTGRLPEWFSELFVSHYRLDTRSFQISNRQLESRFEVVKTLRTEEATAFRKWLFVPFLLLLMLERWLALRKNVATYA